MRRAVMTVTAEVLRDIGPLFDHGLSVDRSLEALRPGEVVLLISGDCLPEECERGPIREVILHLTKETYGRQAIVRVSDIHLTGRTLADVSPLPARAA